MENRPVDYINFLREKIDIAPETGLDIGPEEVTAAFFRQMDYLSPELLRVLKPGRVMAVHVKDRVLFGNATGTGMPTMEGYPAGGTSER